MGTTKRPVSHPVLGGIGANLKRIRDAANLSQGAVAEAAGLSQSTLSRIEKGDYPSLDIDTVVRLSLALGADIYDVLFGMQFTMQIVTANRGRAA